MSGHGFAVDWWTFGVLVYEMVTGRPPFMNKNHHKLGLLIRQGSLIIPDPVKHGIPMSDDIKDLITKLMDKNPDKRLGSNGDADEVVNHPFFQGFDWEKLMSRQLTPPFAPDADFNLKKDKPKSNNGRDNLVSIARDEREDIIDKTQQKLIQENKHKFSGFDN